jgi:hypothetical protein
MVIGTAIGYQGRHMRFNSDGSPILTDSGYKWFLIVLAPLFLDYLPELKSPRLMEFVDAVCWPTQSDFRYRPHQDLGAALLSTHL